MAVAPPGPVLDGAVPALLPTLGTTLGAIEVGVMLAAILYGVTTLQTYIYWQTPKKDKRWLRCLVASVWSVYIPVIVMRNPPINTVLGFARQPIKQLFLSCCMITQ